MIHPAAHIIITLPSIFVSTKKTNTGPIRFLVKIFRIKLHHPITTVYMHSYLPPQVVRTGNLSRIIRFQVQCQVFHTILADRQGVQILASAEWKWRGRVQVINCPIQLNVLSPKIIFCQTLSLIVYCCYQGTYSYYLRNIIIMIYVAPLRLRNENNG